MNPNPLALGVMTWLAMAFTCWSIVGARNRTLDMYFGKPRSNQMRNHATQIMWFVFFAFTGFMLGVYAQAIWRII